MRLKRWLGIHLLALALAVFGLSATVVRAQGGHPEGSHHPPTEGKDVRGHWTPYDPPDPAAFPEDSRIHIIVPNDTLWDLAAKHLGDPWLWPHIWDQNQYILDSHWIYPGDPLLIPPVPTVIGQPVPVLAAPEAGGADAGSGTQVTQVPDVPAAPEPVSAGPDPEDLPPTPVDVSPILAPGAAAYGPAFATGPSLMGPELVPVGDETDLYCSSYLIPMPAPPTLKIAATEENTREMLSDWDIVFLNQGLADGLKSGTEYIVVRSGDTVNHPATGKRVGSLVHQLGRVRILALQEHTATAWISHACREIEVGDGLQVFREIPVPLSAGMPYERYDVDLSGSNGIIIYGHGASLGFGPGDLVELDLGSEDGLQAGDYMTIFRDYSKASSFYSTRMSAEYEPRGSYWDYKSPYPPKVLGQVVILRVEANTATAKIVNSFREVTVGDRVSKL